MIEPHDENKLIKTIIISLVIFIIIIFGTYIVLSNTLHKTTDTENIISSPKPTIVNTASSTPTPIRNYNIDISINDSIVKIVNIPETYNYKIVTTNYKMVINVTGRRILDSKLDISGQSGIVNSVNAISIGEDSIEITINLLRNFNFNEDYSNGVLSLEFYTALNEGVFTYRNDTVRKYIVINGGRISSRDAANIKYYKEELSEDGLNYKIIIDSNRISKVKDEKFIYNDEYLNYINIYSKDNKKIIEFSAKKKLIYYQNTRDYDATITLIEPSTTSNLIVIDAGHGGNDFGAVYEERYEKSITLPVAILAYNLLTDAGYDCYIMREVDEYVGLNERIDIANLLKGKVFINIHANSYKDTSVHGMLTMYKDEKDLAKAIQDNVLALTGAKDMGLVHTDSMLITNKADMPAIILEMGFITNTNEWNNLSDSEYQMKIAQGIKNGVIEYLNSNKE